ncbi:UNVERIFIED_CONTAM: hypothetical protein GTU68_028687 [Idotea baltica]|nr:hypothetical protein [Idotea baltica]
MRSGPV